MPTPHASFASIAVPDGLQPFVAALHQHSGPAPAAAYRRLPGPFAALIVHQGDPGHWRRADEVGWRPCPKVGLQGLFTRWNHAREAPGRHYSIALIEPWAVEALLEVPAAATVDEHLDLEEWRPELGAALRAIGMGSDRLAQIGALLASLVPGSGKSGLAAPLSLIRCEAGAPRVSAAALLAGRSERSLRRLFRAGMGVSPKKWCEIERFAANLRRLHPDPWPHASGQPDYFDQAHEIREFRSMAGITPGAYRREKLLGDRRVFAFG